MSKLITLNNNADKELLSELLNSELIIFEDIQGSKIFVNWDGEQFTMKAKNVKSDWLVIGRAITRGNVKKNIQKLIQEIK